jgi:hypothetical protein
VRWFAAGSKVKTQVVEMVRGFLFVLQLSFKMVEEFVEIEVVKGRRVRKNRQEAGESIKGENRQR